MITVLALDLEGTLISNAMSQIPRPGLHGFLERCRALVGRVVIYTAISEARFRSIAKTLVEEELAPSWFADIEFVQWTGQTKDLNLIAGIAAGEALLVDDLREYVHPGQESQWIAAPPFAAPYADRDTGLDKVINVLESKVDSRG
jgi:hypothetical protein